MDSLEGLTDEQQEAIQCLIESRKTRYFSGVSIEEVIEIFRRINVAKSLGRPDALERENRFFDLCGYIRKRPV